MKYAYIYYIYIYNIPYSEEQNPTAVELGGVAYTFEKHISCDCSSVNTLTHTAWRGVGGGEGGKLTAVVLFVSKAHHCCLHRLRNLLTLYSPGMLLSSSMICFWGALFAVKNIK